MTSSNSCNVNLRLHPNYKRVLNKAQQSHEQNRNPDGIGADDIALARLYSYALRLHTIGAFHATRLAISERPSQGSASDAYRLRAIEALEDLPMISVRSLLIFIVIIAELFVLSTA